MYHGVSRCGKTIYVFWQTEVTGDLSVLFILCSCWETAFGIKWGSLKQIIGPLSITLTCFWICFKQHWNKIWNILFTRSVWAVCPVGSLWEIMPGGAAIPCAMNYRTFLPSLWVEQGTQQKNIYIRKVCALPFISADPWVQCLHFSRASS